MPPSNKATSNVKFLTINDITKGIVVCDGGKTENDGITPTLKDINYLRIRNGDLWVADTCNAALGLRHIPKYDTSQHLSVFLGVNRFKYLTTVENYAKL